MYSVQIDEIIITSWFVLERVVYLEFIEPRGGFAFLRTLAHVNGSQSSALPIVVEKTRHVRAREGVGLDEQYQTILDLPIEVLL